MTGKAEDADGLAPFKGDNAVRCKTGPQDVLIFCWYDYNGFGAKQQRLCKGFHPLHRRLQFKTELFLVRLLRHIPVVENLLNVVILLQQVNELLHF